MTEKATNPGNPGNEIKTALKKLYNKHPYTSVTCHHTG
jgi:hypothetical protein